jgi:hypothetical protein
MSGFDFFKALDRETQRTLTRYTNRLFGLEDTIMVAKPDYCEAAESILAPMMAALEQRYDHQENASYQQMADVKDAYEKLFKALMAADEAENA